MEIKAQSKYVKTTPRKLRLVAKAVSKMQPMEALTALSFLSKDAAMPLSKTIKSAVANAKNQGITDDSLKFLKIEIGEGPTLKRGRAVSRGSWHAILKRTSHITVVLEKVEAQAPKIENPKAQKTAEVKIENTADENKEKEQK